MSRVFYFRTLYKKIITTLYLCYMAEGLTYGINFPFGQSQDGKYLSLSQTPEEEIRKEYIDLLTDDEFKEVFDKCMKEFTK